MNKQVSVVQHGVQNCYVCKTIFMLLLCTGKLGVQICSLFLCLGGVWGGLVGCDAAYDCV
jgi:hypothetical protein